LSPEMCALQLPENESLSTDNDISLSTTEPIISLPIYSAGIPVIVSPAPLPPPPPVLPDVPDVPPSPHEANAKVRISAVIVMNLPSRIRGGGGH
jgi:hypothetical protein